MTYSSLALAFMWQTDAPSKVRDEWVTAISANFIGNIPYLKIHGTTEGIFCIGYVRKAELQNSFLFPKDFFKDDDKLIKQISVHTVEQIKFPFLENSYLASCWKQGEPKSKQYVME